MSKKVAVTLIEDQAKLATFIGQIKARGTKLDQDIHIAALSAVAVFEKHGNVFYINAVYQALGKGARHVAMTTWLTAVGGVKANDGESKDTTPFVKDANKAVNLALGRETPWFMMKPSKAPDEVVDLFAMLQKAIKKAAEPKEGQEVKGADMLPKLRELLEEFTPAESVHGDAGDEDNHA
jgi:hypothetical protein